MFNVNDKALFIVAGIIVSYVLLQSILFLTASLKRARKLNMDMKKIKSVVLASVVFTLAPAFSILIGMITLSKFMGLPLPWLRLSVLGALTYELPAASAAASVTSTSLSSTITDPTTYANIAWVMTCGILSGILIIALFLKRMKKGVIKVKGKDEKWGKIFSDSLFMGMISAFLGLIFANIR